MQLLDKKNAGMKPHLNSPSAVSTTNVHIWEKASNYSFENKRVRMKRINIHLELFCNILVTMILKVFHWNASQT